MVWQNFRPGDVIDETDTLIGHVDQAGRVTDWAGGYVGRARIDGVVLDYNNERIGHLNSEGKLFDWSGTLIGWMNENGHAMDRGGRDVGFIVDMPVFQSGAAAILLLILRVVRTGSMGRKK